LPPSPNHYLKLILTRSFELRRLAGFFAADDGRRAQVDEARGNRGSEILGGIEQRRAHCDAWRPAS
jgi:hypothetical protein